MNVAQKAHILKYQGAVDSWTVALTEQTAKGDQGGIKFCAESLEVAKVNFEKAKESVENWWEWN
jgi:hypothetical protein